MIWYRHLGNVANAIYDVARIRARTYAHARTHTQHTRTDTQAHTSSYDHHNTAQKHNNSVYSLIVTSIVLISYQVQASTGGIHLEIQV